MEWKPINQFSKLVISGVIEIILNKKAEAVCTASAFLNLY